MTTKAELDAAVERIKQLRATGNDPSTDIVVRDAYQRGWEEAIIAVEHVVRTVTVAAGGMQYVIEHDGSAWGSFADDKLAAAWALKHCAGSAWRARPLREPTGGVA